MILFFSPGTTVKEEVFDGIELWNYVVKFRKTALPSWISNDLNFILKEI